jgi:hypothetical protein
VIEHDSKIVTLEEVIDVLFGGVWWTERDWNKSRKPKMKWKKL